MKKATCFLLIWLIILTNIVFVPEAHSQEDEIIEVSPTAIIAIAYKLTTISEKEFDVIYDDFSWYLPLAAQKLEPVGINFYVVERQKVFFKVSDMIDSVDLAKENSPIGYVFISSTGKVLKRFHVLTHIEIVEIAQQFFGL